MLAALASALLVATPTAQESAPTVLVVDEIDGSPVPAITLWLGLGPHEECPLTGADGRARLQSGSGENLPPGAYTLTISDGLHGAWSQHEVTLPRTEPIAITVGPLFFFEFPDWIPEELKTTTARGAPLASPRSNLEVYAAAPSGARVDIRGGLHTTRWNGAATDRWVRFPRPLDDDYSAICVRWDDPYVEARATLTRRAGIEPEMVELQRVELGAVRFPGARVGDLVVLEDAGPEPELPRTAARSSEPLRFERLRPGPYRWRFGPTGLEGDVVVEAGRTVDVQLPRVEPAADATTVPIDVPDGVPPESVRVVARYMLDGMFARSPLAQPGALVLVPEVDRTGALTVQLPELDWASTSLGVAYPLRGRETLLAMKAHGDAGPPERLVAPKDPPRTDVRIRLKNAAEYDSIGQVVWFARDLRGAQDARSAQEVTLALPADRPTSVDVVGGDGRYADFLFDPSASKREFEVELAEMPPYPILVVDTHNRPIPGVQITAGGEVVGVTDAAGRGRVPLTPAGEAQDWTIGRNDPELRPLYPRTKSFRAEHTRAFRGHLKVVFDR